MVRKHTLDVSSAWFKYNFYIWLDLKQEEVLWIRLEIGIPFKHDVGNSSGIYINLTSARVSLRSIVEAMQVHEARGCSIWDLKDQRKRAKPSQSLKKHQPKAKPQRNLGMPNSCVGDCFLRLLHEFCIVVCLNCRNTPSLNADFGRLMHAGCEMIGRAHPCLMHGGCRNDKHPHTHTRSTAPTLGSCTVSKWYASTFYITTHYACRGSTC